MKHGVSMETLCPHECDIPLVRGGHLEGPHGFRFLIYVFPSEIWTQTLKEIMRLKTAFFRVSDAVSWNFKDWPSSPG